MILAGTVALVTFVLLTVEGVPTAGQALPGKRIKLTHTTRSRCSSQCKEPERGETRVTLSSSPATPANDPSLIEKALDNDGGVLVIRFIVSMLTALMTVATIERLLRGDAPPGQSSQGDPAELDPDNSAGSQDQGKERDSGGEDPGDIEEATFAPPRKTTRTEVAEKQALLK
jgi:hypothetical protein